MAKKNITSVTTGVRGITRETRGASVKKFNPTPEINDGLNLGFLTEVKMTKAVWDSDKDFAKQFKNKEVPRIAFVFNGDEDENGQSTGLYIHSFNALPAGSEGWKYDQIFGYVKHFIDTFTEGMDEAQLDEYWNAIAPLLVLDLAEDEKDADTILNAFAKFFEGIELVFNGGTKEMPLIKFVGYDELLWIKLLLYSNGKEVNRGDFGMPNFVGDGVIEKYREGLPSRLSIKIQKGESIIPKEKVAANVPPTASAPTATPAGGANKPGFLKS